MSLLITVMYLLSLTRPFFRTLIVAVAALVLTFSTSRAFAQGDGAALAEFDKPYLFSYGAWTKEQATVAGGKLIVKAPSGQGGVGNNIEANFAGVAEHSPVVRLTIGPNNKLTKLRLMLSDDKGNNALWDFSLAGMATGQDLTLFPIDGAPFSMPSELGKTGAPNLAKIRQVQIIGNWQVQAVDLSIESISHAEPDAGALAAREARAKGLAQEAAQRLQLQEKDKARYRPGMPQSPTVEHVAAVAPDVLAIEIQAGKLVPSSFAPYVAEPGDTVKDAGEAKGGFKSLVLTRGKKEVGWLTGRNHESLTTFEAINGDPLLGFEADLPANYTVTLPDGTQVKPLWVGRKSRPSAWAHGPRTIAMRHTIYLKLATPLEKGKKYSVAFAGLNLKQPTADFVFDPATVRSEAVHVNQIGYRADDPIKRAFVSCWLGSAGSLKLPDSLSFSLVDEKTGLAVFSGTSADIWRADKAEKLQREANFNGTDVARLDFSAFNKPGRYRVVVEGIGASYPFEIGANAWREAFLTQMHGLFVSRSGMAIGPPYSEFKKPRDMHPADGYRVTKSKYRFVEKGGEAWSDIAAGDTGEPVPQAWGGYHDAGDWQPRRVTHMKTTRAQLEVYEMFPAYFSQLKLNIPSDTNPTKVPLPDILTEALWEFECFHRLQQPDGGVPYGIETGLGDPLPGEVSWNQAFPGHVFTADYSNSWFYASVGARLAAILERYDAKLAQTYRDSATRAFDFAEADYARDKAAGLTEKRDSTWQALDHRNLAALELFRLTREKRFNDIFLQGTVLTQEKPNLFVWGVANQREAAFIYACLPKGMGDETLKATAVAATERMAQKALSYADKNAFGLTSSDQGKPQFLGFYATPDAIDLTRAHFLTGKKEYLAGAVQANQFLSGANPNNQVMMTGLGANPVQNTFQLDARATGQKVPAGLAPFGNLDLAKWNNSLVTWPITWVFGSQMQPNAYAWPANEFYFDLGSWPMLEEFVIDTWAPTVQVWGYLAARESLKP